MEIVLVSLFVVIPCMVIGGVLGAFLWSVKHDTYIRNLEEENKMLWEKVISREDEILEAKRLQNLGFIVKIR